MTQPTTSSSFLRDLVKDIMEDTTAKDSHVSSSISPASHPVLSSQELAEIKSKAFKTAISKIYQAHYTEELMENEEFLSSDKQYDDLRQTIKAMTEKKKSGNSTHIFFTVNTRPGTSVQNLLKKIIKCSNKKWVTDIAVVIEQRGEDQVHMGEGIHAHIIVNRGTEACKARRELKNTFKDLCDVENPHCLNIQWRKDSGVEKAFNYIKGIKKDKEKTAKMEIDKIWREKNNIKDYYQTDDLKKK